MSTNWLNFKYHMEFGVHRRAECRNCTTKASQPHILPGGEPFVSGGQPAALTGAVFAGDSQSVVSCVPRLQLHFERVDLSLKLCDPLRTIFEFHLAPH